MESSDRVTSVSKSNLYNCRMDEAFKEFEAVEREIFQDDVPENSEDSALILNNSEKLEEVAKHDLIDDRKEAKLEQNLLNDYSFSTPKVATGSRQNSLSGGQSISLKPVSSKKTQQQDNKAGSSKAGSIRLNPSTGTYASSVLACNTPSCFLPPIASPETSISLSRYRPISKKSINSSVLTGSTKFHQAKQITPATGALAFITNSTNSLRLNTGHQRTGHMAVMLSIIQDPIQCGYLLQFCAKEHNSENLCFVMMVSRFRDAMATDKQAWPKPWTEIDIELKQIIEASPSKPNEINESDHMNSSICPLIPTTWPSKKLSKPMMEKLLQSIWDNFLCDSAPNQICMPSHVAENTWRRIQYFDLYGPEVYAEALLDPIKTLNKDVLPRFLTSPLYSDMKLRLSSLQRTKSTLQEELVVPPPTHDPFFQHRRFMLTTPARLSNKSTKPAASVRDNDSLLNEKKMFSLLEILANRTLYLAFLTHLQKSMTSENLLCYRMITLFEEAFLGSDTPMQAEMDSPSSEKKELAFGSGMYESPTASADSDMTLAVNYAWKIYRYFVAPDAPFEVSLHSRHKKELMISLACPYANMFDELKKSTYGMLSVNFNAFKFTPEYKQLWKVMKEARNNTGVLGGLRRMIAKPASDMIYNLLPLQPIPSATLSPTVTGAGSPGGNLAGRDCGSIKKSKMTT